MITAPTEPFIASLELLRDRVPDFESYPFCIPAAQPSYPEDEPSGDILRRGKWDRKVNAAGSDRGRGGLQPGRGSRNFRFATRESHSALYECLRLTRGPRRTSKSDGFFFRAESYFNLATKIEELGVLKNYGSLSLHEQSHGESFLSLVLNRFWGDGIYLLDEPESALSPRGKCRLSRPCTNW